MSTGHREVLFQFIKDDDLFLNEKPYSIVRTKDLPSEESSNIQYEWWDVTHALQNVRGRESDFNLEISSLCWIKHRSEVRIDSEEKMMVPYAKETNNLLRKLFNTSDVICYDLRWRRNATFTDEEAFSNSRSVPSPPVRIVHIDHTPEGGHNRVRRHLSPEEIERFCTGDYRIRIVNVWRPLFRAIEENPIAFCDPRTVDPQDLIRVDRVTPVSHIEIFQLKHNAGQKWYWMQGQKPDEPCIFVQWDSHPPDGQFNVVPHTTFADPNPMANAVPRESIETRSIVFTKF